LGKTPWSWPQLGILSPASVSSVSLLGTGWLGLPLGKSLHAAGYTVHAATTQEAKISLLAKEGFIPHLLEVGNDVPTPPPPRGGGGVGIWHSDTIIVTLPFRRNFIDPWIYVDQMREIVSKLASHQRVLLTSSTSYYPDCDHDVDEDLAFSPIAPRLKALAAAEAVIMSHTGPSSVLRLGGLYGPDRQIGSFAKRGLPKRSLSSRVNLIHRDDVIGIILRMMTANVGWGTVLNAVSDGHPTRGELYGIDSPPLPLPGGDSFSSKAVAIKSPQLSKEKNDGPALGRAWGEPPHPQPLSQRARGAIPSVIGDYSPLPWGEGPGVREDLLQNRHAPRSHPKLVGNDQRPGDASFYSTYLDANDTPSGKSVSNHKLKMALDYQFCYPNPLASIEGIQQ